MVASCVDGRTSTIARTLSVSDDAISERAGFREEHQTVMRSIGQLPDRGQALQFVDFLFTQGISAELEEDPQAGSVLWVRDEDRVAEAGQWLREFQASPQDARFQVASQANRLRKQQVEQRQRASAQTRTMSERWGNSASILARPTPITIGLVLICVALSLATDFARGMLEAGPRDSALAVKLSRILVFVDPEVFVQRGEDPLASVRRGELWRVYTTTLLHGSMMHLVFNMLALYSLASILERLQGSWWLIGVLLILTTVSVLLQALLPHRFGGSPFAIGISGVVYGLFGYLWIRPKVDPWLPIRMPDSAVWLMLGWLVLCFTNFSAIPNAANIAHLSGLLCGMALAVLPSFGVRSTQ